jgi:hypothetical protein
MVKSKYSIPKYLILLIVIITIIIFIIIFNKLYKKNNNYELFDNQLYASANYPITDPVYTQFYDSTDYKEPNKYLTYYRCKDKMLGKIVKNIFDSNNIIQSNDNWNIYIPCGYNNVESELKDIVVDKDKNKDTIKSKYIFGLNGCDSIVSKNQIWESLVKCYGRDYASKLMPESYVLGDPNEMMIFRKNFNASGKDIYILKKNVQRKEGLKLTKDYFEILGGIADNYRVAQKYITDLYLINERKVNLRIYLLIVIKDSMVYFYLSNIGKCIYTNKKYNDNNFDFESNITSYHLDMNIYKENPRDLNELKDFIDKNESKNFKSLEANSNNKYNSYNNYHSNEVLTNKKSGKMLLDNIQLLIKDVSKCLANNVYQSKNIKGAVTFQLFGGDVIFDTNLHPYLLEFNKGPDMTPRDNIDEKMKNDVQSDMFKIVGVIPNNKNENNINHNSFKLIYQNSVVK